MANQTLREAIEEYQEQLERRGWESNADDLRAILARFPKPSGPTVRVRIALVTSSTGWTAYGYSKMRDEDALALCRENKESEDWRVQFVEVDALLPEAPVTLEGTVLP